MYRRRGILLYIAGEGDILLYIAGEGDILLCIAGEGDIPLCIAGEGDILLCIAGLSLPRLPEELVPGRSPPAVVRVFRVWDARATGVGWRRACCRLAWREADDEACPGARRPLTALSGPVAHAGRYLQL